MMRSATRCSIAIVLLAVSAQAVPKPLTCPELPGMVPPHCLAGPEGWFYADSVEAAAQLVDDAREAAERFRHHFAMAAPRGAIVALGSARLLTPMQIDALHSHGAGWVLPWLALDERQRLLEQGVRRAVRAQLGDSADERVVEQAVERALQVRASESDDARGALRHEIGHMLLIRAFWPDAPTRSGGHYGGPGPDWLDEVAAVLMENESLTARRRMQLQSLLDGEQAHAGLLPLSEFLTASHPLAALAQGIGAPPGDSGGARVTVLGADDDRTRALVELGAAFYVQARALADFLIEQSGSEAVFGEIARWLATEGSIETWLARHGADFGLGSSVAALERQWQHWLAKK